MVTGYEQEEESAKHLILSTQMKISSLGIIYLFLSIFFLTLSRGRYELLGRGEKIKYIEYIEQEKGRESAFDNAFVFEVIFTVAKSHNILYIIIII